MTRWLAAGLCVVASVMLSCGGSALECGKVPCPDEMLLWGDLSYKGNDSVHLSVRLCRNDECSEDEVEAGPLGHDEVLLAAPVPALVTLASRSASDLWHLSVALNDHLTKEGDILSMKLTTVPGGTVIFDKTTRPVKFQTTNPNGPECDSCRVATPEFN